MEARDLCHPLSTRSEFYAGFYDAKKFEEIEDEMDQSMGLRKHLLLVLPVAVVVFIVLLGELI